MSFFTKHLRLVLVGGACLAAGAGASVIATAGASTTASTTHAGRAHHHADGLRGLARRAVHGTVVVSTPKGFRTVTFDRGTVQAVSGDRLTVTDGTRRHAYKTVTLTIPATARIRDNHARASLSAVTPGQRVTVIRAPQRTMVIAHTPRRG